MKSVHSKGRARGFTSFLLGIYESGTLDKRQNTSELKSD
jgi:hypothetical protein